MRRFGLFLGLLLLLAACADDQMGAVGHESSSTTSTVALPSAPGEPAGSTNAPSTTGGNSSALQGQDEASSSPEDAGAQGGDDQGGCGQADEGTPGAEDPAPPGAPDESEPGDFPETVTVTPPTGVTGEVPADLLALVVDNLAARAGVAPDEIAVMIAESVIWPDGSLGCPAPGDIYQPVPVPGYRVLLQAAAVSYNYHLAGSGYFVLCDSHLPPP